MAFTVAVGSGVAIIPCGNITASPYTRTPLFPHLPSSSSPRTRRKLHVVCANEPLDDDVSVYNKVLGDEDEDDVDDVSAYKFIETLDLQWQKPDFWEGPQWDWFGTFVKYSWIIGIPVAASLALYGCFTFHEPPKRVKETAAKLYSVQSGMESNAESSVESNKVFEEPDAYDSDVFDSNPTEVAPSLE